MDGKRTVFITGGTRGIGRELVETFAANGYNVAFCYKSSRDKANKIISELSARNINALALECDVSSYKAVERAYADIKAHFGFADTVINNAGVSRYALFTDEKECDFDRIVNQNLKSVYNTCNIFVRDMISRKFGRIINMSSVWGVCGASMETLYSMTKAGVIGLTKALAKELAPSGVTVNSIAAGYIDTEMNSRFTAEEKKAIIDEIPIGRAGNVRDVAAAALYLASENAGFVTGEILNVNGGVL